MKLLFDDALCEEVVEREMGAQVRGGDPAAMRDFRRAADAIYRTIPLQRRQAAFLSLYQRTLAALPHAGRLERLICEIEPDALLPAACLFSRAFKGEEEGIQLSEDASILGVRIRTETLLDEAACAYLLRHELTHIQDMLDPRFEHDPASPLAPAAPSEESLLRDRYRTLWDLSVDGRLGRSGRLPSDVRERRAAEFRSLFPALDEESAAKAIETLWSGPRPSDPAFRRMVRGAPELCAALGIPFEASASRERPARSPGGSPCPLCRFTTFEWAEASPGLIEAVQADYPAWSPSQGLCTQCANRYLLGAFFAPVSRSDGRTPSLTGGSRR
ncbi:MAG: hypothetical protein HYZ11_05020 [Candidatus Tectomicrobia bacterium]|uniref:Uncharacterized protein n=1 Tax=Tectimicrobiota bacterium TaxID=2528274 RepID=A0A932HYT4_UNCTE|nr:hypothetical protein [Candidatus Tectomicrobia bacterium]